MVNPDDEAKYVESGWRLLSGDIRDLAWGPVIALVYAPIHLIVGSSPDWFLLETWIGTNIPVFIFMVVITLSGTSIKRISVTLYHGGCSFCFYAFFFCGQKPE